MEILRLNQLNEVSGGTISHDEGRFVPLVTTMPLPVFDHTPVNRGPIWTLPVEPPPPLD